MVPSSFKMVIQQMQKEITGGFFYRYNKLPVMTQLQVLRSHIYVSIIREQYGDYTITPGGYSRFQVTAMIRGLFSGLKFQCQDCFGWLIVIIIVCYHFLPYTQYTK